MRVLLIEDDHSTAQSVELMLRADDCSFYAAHIGAEGIELGKLYDYSIILLDLNLPDISGYEVLRDLRLANVHTPILIMSGIADIQSKVKGLGLGADDYITKPFHKDELLARINAIIRRSKLKAPSIITVDDLVINLDDKTTSIAGTRVSLTGKEFKILEVLAQRKGAMFTKEMLLNQLYGGINEPNIKIIDVFVCKLRKKLFDSSEGRNYIETVYGRGYGLRVISEPSNRLPTQPAAELLGGVAYG